MQSTANQKLNELRQDFEKERSKLLQTIYNGHLVRFESNRKQIADDWLGSLNTELMNGVVTVSLVSILQFIKSNIIFNSK